MLFNQNMTSLLLLLELLHVELQVFNSLEPRLSLLRLSLAHTLEQPIRPLLLVLVAVFGRPFIELAMAHLPPGHKLVLVLVLVDGLLVLVAAGVAVAEFGFLVEGEVFFNFIEHLRVGGGEVLGLFVGDNALLVDAEDAVGGDLNPEVGDGVSLPVPEPRHNRTLGVGEYFVDAGQQLDLELVGGLFDDFPGERLEVAVGTHQQGARGQPHGTYIRRELPSSTSFSRNLVVCPYCPMALAVMYRIL